MIFKRSVLTAFALVNFALLGLGCSSTASKPAALTPLPESTTVSFAWRNLVEGRVDIPLQLATSANALVAADNEGNLIALTAATGRALWRLALKAELTAGVGFEGNTAAVVTKDNELIVITVDAQRQPTVAWRTLLPARVYTSPLVAGGRVFVLASNRVLHAFDAATGDRLWQTQRSNDSLVLSQSAALGVYKNSLIMSNSAKLLAINPNAGQVQWEITVATSRATNEIERLIDLIGAPQRFGNSICVRSFQTNVSCVEAEKIQLQWSKQTQGSTALGGDAMLVVGSESDGKVKAWWRANGEPVWVNENLIFRQLSAPLVLGASVFVGDFEGYVHVLDKVTGKLKARFPTDSSPIVAPPIAIGNLVVVLTRKGGIYAFNQQNS